MIAADAPQSHQEAFRLRSVRPTGAVLGIVVFLAGVGLVGWAFWLAWGLFSRPPELALGLKVGEPLDFGGAATALFHILVRALMLLMMAGAGSAIANRGVRLYAASSGPGRDQEG
jgi:hypothetical protein